MYVAGFLNVKYPAVLLRLVYTVSKSIQMASNKKAKGGDEAKRQYITMRNEYSYKLTNEQSHPTILYVTHSTRRPVVYCCDYRHCGEAFWRRRS